MAIRIVTDSTSDMSQALLQEYGIEMVPLTVHFGPDSYKDAVEMDADAFWAKLQSSSHHPKTAQPSPGDFLTVYEPIAAAGDEIVSIHVSGKMSGTSNSAQIAAQMLPNAKITIIDTKSVTLGLGMIAIHAARMASEGKSAAEIAAEVSAIADRMNILFTLDSLDFLQKNGRVGKAQALLGGLLGIRPVLQVDKEGLVAPADKVRGKSKVLPRTLELMQERVPAGRRINLAILHTRAEAEAGTWLETVKQVYQVAESRIAEIGPVVATNTGPGTLGVVFYEA